MHMTKDGNMILQITTLVLFLMGMSPARQDDCTCVQLDQINSGCAFLCLLGKIDCNRTKCAVQLQAWLRYMDQVSLHPWFEIEKLPGPNRMRLVINFNPKTYRLHRLSCQLKTLTAALPNSFNCFQLSDHITIQPQFSTEDIQSFNFSMAEDKNFFLKQKLDTIDAVHVDCKFADMTLISTTLWPQFLKKPCDAKGSDAYGPTALSMRVHFHQQRKTEKLTIFWQCPKYWCGFPVAYEIACINLRPYRWEAEGKGAIYPPNFCIRCVDQLHKDGCLACWNHYYHDQDIKRNNRNIMEEGIDGVELVEHMTSWRNNMFELVQNIGFDPFELLEKFELVSPEVNNTRICRVRAVSTAGTSEWSNVAASKAETKDFTRPALVIQTGNINRSSILTIDLRDHTKLRTEDHATLRSFDFSISGLKILDLSSEDWMMLTHPFSACYEWITDTWYMQDTRNNVSWLAQMKQYDITGLNSAPQFSHLVEIDGTSHSIICSSHHGKVVYTQKNKDEIVIKSTDIPNIRKAPETLGSTNTFSVNPTSPVIALFGFSGNSVAFINDSGICAIDLDGENERILLRGQQRYFHSFQLKQIQSLTILGKKLYFSIEMVPGIQVVTLEANSLKSISEYYENIREIPVSRFQEFPVIRSHQADKSKLKDILKAAIWNPIINRAPIPKECIKPTVTRVDWEMTSRTNAVIQPMVEWDCSPKCIHIPTWKIRFKISWIQSYKVDQYIAGRGCLKPFCPCDTAKKKAAATCFETETSYNSTLSETVPIGDLLPDTVYYVEVSVESEIIKQKELLQNWYGSVSNDVVSSMKPYVFQFTSEFHEPNYWLIFGLPIALVTALLAIVVGALAWAIHRDRLHVFFFNVGHIRAGRIQVEETIGQGNFAIIYRGILKPSTQWSWLVGLETCFFCRNKQQQHQHQHQQEIAADEECRPLAASTLKKMVAIKELKNQATLRQKAEFQQEALILAKLRSWKNSNIAYIHGACLSKRPMWLVLKYINGGSLDKYLKGSFARQHLVSSSLLKIVQQVCKGCKFLEDKGVIHRDISAKNCLVEVKGDGQWTNILITDFGLSKEVSDMEGKVYTESEDDGVFPTAYTAPEALEHGWFSSKTDVWSFGVLIWEVFSWGSAPFKEYGACLPDLQNHQCPQLQGLAKESKLITLFVCSEKKNLLDQPSVPCCSLLRAENESRGIHDLISLMKLCFEPESKSRPSFLNVSQKLDSMMVLFLRNELQFESVELVEPVVAVTHATDQLTPTTTADRVIIHDREKDVNYAKNILQNQTALVPQEYSSSMNVLWPKVV